MTVISYQIHNKIINNFFNTSLVEFKKYIIFSQIFLDYRFLIYFDIQQFAIFSRCVKNLSIACYFRSICESFSWYLVKRVGRSVTDLSRCCTCCYVYSCNIVRSVLPRMRRLRSVEMSFRMKTAAYRDM